MQRQNCFRLGGLWAMMAWTIAVGHNGLDSSFIWLGWRGGGGGGNRGGIGGAAPSPFPRHPPIPLPTAGRIKKILKK